MKTKTMSFAAAMEYKPANPERTGRRNASGYLNFDIVFREWPNRASLAKTIRMQQKRESRSDDWSAVVKLGAIEGY